MFKCRRQQRKGENPVQMQTKGRRPNKTNILMALYIRDSNRLQLRFFNLKLFRPHPIL